MKPETEHVARQLAAVVLRDDCHPRDMPAVGMVEVHMKGISHEVRRQILVDHVHLADKIATEIERQTAGVDIDALIAKAVREEVGRVQFAIPSLVKTAVSDGVDRAIRGAVGQAAAAAVVRLTEGVAERLHEVAYPTVKRKRK